MHVEGRGRGAYGGEFHTIYWRCDVGQLISETVCLPLINAKREEALLGAIQQVHWTFMVTFTSD